ncbi:MAG: RNase adapter RapZ [Oscillospiraceae bacterium]|nr:RNase adapter RapZ [Oscillospiraceae bacterium]MBQ3048446.1 RNase adapter RapZ [Oscillospiraceae bacterium]
MNIIILTGLSGAGKSQASSAFEDIGYYCVDNLPPALLKKFAELCVQSGDQQSDIVVVIDVRSSTNFDELLHVVDGFDGSQINCTIVYLEAEDKTLINRYKQTRRRHPLVSEDEDDAASLENAIIKERKILEPVKNRANYIIDTSLFSASQLNERIISTFADKEYSGMVVTCTSFGYKYGIPSDADLVFDVRCLPNPFYIPELKEKTGTEQEVRDFVLNSQHTEGLISHLFSLIDYLLPLYAAEGKRQLTVAVGCTGGKHRSVVIAEQLQAHFREKEIKAVINHRDKLKSKG